jgi:serine/threonine protein kinase
MATNSSNAQSTSALYIVDDYPVDVYTPISIAGCGNWGVVYFSLRKQDYEAAVKNKTVNTFDELRSKLVALKVCPNSPVESAEVKTLRAIQASVDENHRGLFVSLVDHGYKWIATEAITPSVSLFDLVHPIPEELILHILLGMTKASRFLYEGCATPMIHGDFHPGNILIDPTSQTESGLPGLVVFDFDHSKPVEKFEDAWEDFRIYARLLLNMLKRHGYGNPIEGWDQINDYVSNAASLASFEGLCGAIQARLDEAMADTTSEKMHTLREQLRIAAVENEAKLQSGFREAGLID